MFRKMLKVTVKITVIENIYYKTQAVHNVACHTSKRVPTSYRIPLQCTE